MIEVARRTLFPGGMEKELEEYSKRREERQHKIHQMAVEITAREKGKGVLGLDILGRIQERTNKILKR